MKHPCVIRMKDGTVVETVEPINQARKKWNTRGWHSFELAGGNSCHVNCAEIESIRPARK